MSEQRVGTCSICGGEVRGVRGSWMSVDPPPPDHCVACGAVARADVIQMVPRPIYPKQPQSPQVVFGGEVWEWNPGTNRWTPKS